MAKPPAFQLYAADFDMDTAAWDNEEIGIYLRLLLYQWVNKQLPNDLTALSRIVRLSRTKFEKKWIKISKKFVMNREGFFINLRMEQERNKQQNYIEKQRLKGIKSGEKRRTVVEATVEPRYEPEGNSSKKKEIYKEKAALIYQSYPKQTSKQTTINSIIKLLKDPTNGLLPCPVPKLLITVDNYKDYVRENVIETKFLINSYNFFGRNARYKEFMDYIPQKGADKSCLYE